MKRNFGTLLIIILLFFFNACIPNEEQAIDYTQDVVGTYEGTLTITDDSNIITHKNQSVKVEKHNNLRIQVSPSLNSKNSSFLADVNTNQLLADNNTEGIGTIRVITDEEASSNIQGEKIGELLDMHGEYTKTSTQATFKYKIKTVVRGVEIIESFEGKR